MRVLVLVLHSCDWVFTFIEVAGEREAFGPEGLAEVEYVVLDFGTSGTIVFAVCFSLSKSGRELLGSTVLLLALIVGESASIRVEGEALPKDFAKGLEASPLLGFKTSGDRFPPLRAVLRSTLLLRGRNDDTDV